MAGQPRAFGPGARAASLLCHAPHADAAAAIGGRRALAGGSILLLAFIASIPIVINT